MKLLKSWKHNINSTLFNRICLLSGVWMAHVRRAQEKKYTYICLEKHIPFF